MKRTVKTTLFFLFFLPLLPLSPQAQPSQETISQYLYGYLLTWSKFSPEDVGKSRQLGMAKIVNKAFEGCRTDGTWNFKGRISDDGNTVFLTDKAWLDRWEENLYHRER